MVAAFNVGTAVGSSLAGHALDSGLGPIGPAVIAPASLPSPSSPTTAIAERTRRHLLTTAP